MPQETKVAPVAPGAEPSAPPSPAGWSADLTDDATTHAVLEKAFDYRGDVTLTLKSGHAVTGYLFDRKTGAGLADSSVRLLGAGGEERVRVAYADIRRVEFSDRDPAAGKSFETWVKKYVEKKLKGESASIHSEALD